MGIPFGQQIVVEVKVKANIAAGGGRIVPVSNTFHYRRTTQPASINKTAFYNAFKTNVLDVITLAMNVRWVTAATLVRCVDDAEDAYSQHFPAATGARVLDSYESQAAIYMQLQSGVRGRFANGSKHFSPLSEEDTTGDILVAGLARWQAVATAMLVNFTDAVPVQWVPVILAGKPKSQIKANPTTVKTYDVISIALNKAVGKMKRRYAGSVYA